MFKNYILLKVLDKYAKNSKQVSLDFAGSPAPAPELGGRVRLKKIANQSDLDFASKTDCASKY